MVCPIGSRLASQSVTGRLMVICNVSIEGRYGWKTVPIKKFVRNYSMTERYRMVADLTRAYCINEIGEIIHPRLALKLLEELEAHCCQTASDLSLFLKIYSPESEYRALVEEKLVTVMQDEEP